MNFPFDDFNNFSIQHASHSCRALAPTNYPKIFTHMDHVHIAPILIIVLVIVHLGDNSIILHEQMNTNFSSLGFELISNFYNLD
jgi:hypothetical protein